MNLSPLSLAPQRDEVPLFGAGLSLKSLELLCRSLGTMLQSGIGIQKAFDLAAKRTGDPKAQRALHGVNLGIARGQDISSSMREQEGAFPGLLIDMIGVAEQTGALPEILLSLADHYDNNRRLRRAFFGQIAWPVFQLVVAVLIIALVMLVLGWIGDANKGPAIDILGFGLTGEKGALIWLGATFGSAFALFLLYQVVAKGFGGKRALDGLFMSIPLVGNCMSSFAIARFSWAFYLTQQTGMPIARSLTASLKATDNGLFIEATRGICDAVKSGDSLGDALAASRLFPEDYIQTVHVAESSGTVPEQLYRLSPQFEEQARRSMSALSAGVAWLVWALVAAFIIFIIFRIFSWYIGMINDAVKQI